ncbi:MAG TPA: hypothetical protein VF086_09380 [Propionibacteriaceae bacterium]
MTVGFVGTADLAVLRDGRRVQPHPVRPEDEEQIVQFLRDLSVDAIYSRFFTRRPDLAREASGGDRSCAVGLPARTTPGSLRRRLDGSAPSPATRS